MKKVLIGVTSILNIAFLILSLYVAQLEEKIEILQRQKKLFSDQIYDVSIAACEGGENHVMLNILSHMPADDDNEEHCRHNAKSSMENFHKYQEDTK